MRKAIISIISIVFVIVFLLGFVDKIEEVDDVNKGSLVYSIYRNSNNFKCVGNLSEREQDIICATSRGLIEIDDTGKILPSLAESVEVKDNGIEYNFKIRDDIYWSDGSKITTTDIREYFRQAILEEQEDDISALLDIYGAREYRNGASSFNKTVAIEARDNNLIIRLNHKNDDFLVELSKPQYRIRENILLWDDMKSNYQSLKFSGNYKIEFFEEESIHLVRSEYSNKSLSEKIIFVKDESEEMAMAAFEIGNRDVVIDPPRGQLHRLKSENRLVTMESDTGLYLAYNPESTLSLAAKKDIYGNIVKALEVYKNSNLNLLVMAEGSYFRKDKDDLDKLQARKVSINIDQQWDEERVIKILAEESTINKEICECIVKWFNDNTKQTIIYDLLKKEELKSISKYDKYDIILMENYNNPNGGSGFYVKAESYLPKSILETINDENIEEGFYKLEQTLFDSCIVLPLVFFNENVAISDKITQINMDGNGNIDFCKLK